MDSNQDPSVHRLLDFIALNLLVFSVAVFVVWLLIAILAAAVAPDDRPWSFFWCTVPLLGPLGVALPLLSSTPTTRGARRTTPMRVLHSVDPARRGVGELVGTQVS